MAAKKTAFMKWIDSELERNPKLAREVEETLKPRRARRPASATDATPPEPS